MGGTVAFALFSTHLITGQIAKVLGASSVGQSDQIYKDISDPYDPRLVEQNTPMPDSNFDPKWAMVIDVGACIGCRRCMHACRQENNISETIYPLWIEICEFDSSAPITSHSDENWTTKYTNSPRPGKRYLPIHCMHCDNPTCAKVCPTGARYRSEDGIVDTHYDSCIGCRYCVTACPYSVNRFNWSKPKFDPKRKINPEVPIRPIGVVEKCTFCAHRVRKGLYPRCVEVCPVKAKRFGNLNDPNSEVSKTLVSFPSNHLLDELGTKPSIHFTRRGAKWDIDGERL
jgi:Fe-S-cluster-containing dehydrogenase component